MALSADKILYLLDELCRRQGFCLAPEQKLRISQIDELDAQALADEVLLASGFRPQYENQRRREVVAAITHYLDRWAQS